jgi:hypothetical protein
MEKFLNTPRIRMEKTRIDAAASMLVTAIFIACADGSPTDLGKVTSHDGGGLPIACAQWTCSALACGYNTSYPAWACCVTNIYEGPDGYNQPLDSVPGYQCGLGSSGGQYDAQENCNQPIENDSTYGSWTNHNICGDNDHLSACVSTFYCHSQCDDDSPCKIAERYWTDKCLESTLCQNN